MQKSSDLVQRFSFFCKAVCPLWLPIVQLLYPQQALLSDKKGKNADCIIHVCVLFCFVFFSPNTHTYAPTLSLVEKTMPARNHFLFFPITDLLINLST